MKAISQDPAPPTSILPEEEYQKLLSAMRLEYGRLLPDKLTELSTEWELLVHEWEPERRTRFIRLAHSLAGSAGSYGYPCISESARTLELFVKANLGDTPPSPDDICAVTTLLAALQIEKEDIREDTSGCAECADEGEHMARAGQY